MLGTVRLPQHLSALAIVACIALSPGQALAGEASFAAVASRPDIVATIASMALIVALILWFAVIHFDRFSVVHGPEILTTAGIFGCFLGISIGLWNFDVAHIADSVPQLIGGIRTAFFSSLTGIVGALAIRLRHRFTRKPIAQSAEAPKAASLDDLVSATLSLKQSISGDDESTLISQIRLTRQESADQLRGLRMSFDTFAERMTENNSRALVDALREVIHDFNARINEQFGDNFKHLNEAVEKLVLWQDQYRQQLTEMISAQASTAQDMKSASGSFGALVSSAESFFRVADQLDTITGKLEGTLERSLASEEALHGVLVQMRGAIPEFNQSITSMVDQITKGTIRVSAEVEQSARSLTEAVQAAHGEMKKLLAESIEQANRQVLSDMRKAAEATEREVRALDEALSTELTKALEMLGRQLASLSEKFVADYEPLTERLRKLLELAPA